MAHVEGGDVADAGQGQVELQSLLLVALDLGGHADGLAFPLFHVSKLRQQAGRLLGPAAEEQTHPRPHQRRQRAVIVTGGLEGARGISCRGGGGVNGKHLAKNWPDPAF